MKKFTDLGKGGLADLISGVNQGKKPRKTFLYITGNLL